MSTQSRFELPLEDSQTRLPLLLTAEAENDLQQLAKEICEFDPDLADILFGMTFPTASREEQKEKIAAWGKA